MVRLVLTYKAVLLKQPFLFIRSDLNNVYSKHYYIHRSLSITHACTNSGCCVYHLLRRKCSLSRLTLDIHYVDLTAWILFIFRRYTHVKLVWIYISEDSAHIYIDTVIISPLHWRWNVGILDLTWRVSVRTTVWRQVFRNFFGNNNICSFYVIPGIYLYGVNHFAPINFLLLPAIWCPNICTKMGFRKLLAQWISYMAFSVMICVSWSLFIFVFLRTIMALWGGEYLSENRVYLIFLNTISKLVARKGENGGFRNFLPITLQWAKWCQNFSENRVFWNGA